MSDMPNAKLANMCAMAANMSMALSFAEALMSELGADTPVAFINQQSEGRAMIAQVDDDLALVFKMSRMK